MHEGYLDSDCGDGVEPLWEEWERVGHQRDSGILYSCRRKFKEVLE